MRTDNKTLIKALRILADDIQSADGIANAAILEGAQRIEELEAKNAKLKQELNSLVAGLHSEKDINKIKADAIREAADKCAWWHDREFVKIDEIIDYADKVEKGEI